MSGIGDEDGVLPLGACLPIFRPGGPFIELVDNGLRHPGIDHRLNRERHSGNQRDIDRVPVMGNLRPFVELHADPMPDELVHH